MSAPRRHSGEGAARLPDGQRGMALIAVTAALTVIAVIASDFGTRTSLGMLAAAHHRDSVRAHFLARSALNLSELLIKLQQRADNMQQFQGVQLTEPTVVNMLLPAFCGSSEELRDFLGVDPSDAKGLGIAAGGNCGIEITSDDGKINANCARSAGEVPKTLLARIGALYYFPAYDPIFEVEDAEGWRRDRDTQSYAILDYIDGDSARWDSPGGGANEDYGYENLKDKYKPKNNYLDTVDELRLVRGVDDRFWTLFGDAFTVYGGCKSNIGAIDNVGVIAATLSLAAKDPNDPVLRDPAKLWQLSNLVLKVKQMSIPFTSLEDFASFVKDPVAFLGQSAASLGGSAQSGAVEAMLGLPPGTKIGMELDAQKLGQVAVAGPRRTYRVTAYGEAIREQRDAEGNYIFPPVRRTITGVWDTKVTTQNGRDPRSRNGAWVYLRED